MDNHSFNLLIRPLNIEYCRIFGEIPRITDYSCSRDEYIAALKNAIKNRKILADILLSRKNQYQNMSQFEE